jgi:UDP-N-acetylglucosamine acyltransferase
MTCVHETAVVDPRASLAGDAFVGPFCVVGPDVVLGPGCRLDSHVVVTGRTFLGARCHVHPFAVVGGTPQDRKYRDEPSALEVGDDVTIREHATIHRGTAAGDGRTVVGDRALLMASTHVAHDCFVGPDVTLTNGATLAGHVVVEPFAVLGGFAAVGQMLRVGESAMLAAGAMAEQDVPPFCIVAGDRARVRAVNVVGLRRRGIDERAIDAIKGAFRVLFRRDRPIADAAADLRSAGPVSAEVARLLAFVEASRRGLCR